MSQRSFRRAHERRLAAERRRAALKRRRAGLATGAAIGATVLFAPPAQAATFEVNTLSDGPPGPCEPLGGVGADCTLRDAIEAANGNSEADTISFASTLTGTIRLVEGELGITASEPLSIDGPGLDVLSISGDAMGDGPDDGDSRIFNVDTEAPVSITGLTLTEGRGSGDGKYVGGGAVLMGPGSDVTIADARLIDNLAVETGESDSKYSVGGAILNSGGALVVNRSDVAGNEADLGGGISSRGGSGAPASATVTDSTVEGNQGLLGGGVYSSGLKFGGGDGDSSGATLSVVDSSVSGNVVGGLGGGSLTKYTDTAFSRSTVADNEAQGLAGIGGFSGPVKVSESEISGNAAEGAGGGIGIGRYGALDLTDSEVTGNSAVIGGGVDLRTSDYDQPDGPPPSANVIARTTIADNSAIEGGAGVAVSDIRAGDSIRVSESTLAGNEGGEDSQGGGIALTGEIAGEFTLSNSTVSGNTAAFGGGVSFDDPGVEPPEMMRLGADRGEVEGASVAEGGSLTLSNSTIAANTAAERGGGLFLGRYDDSQAGDEMPTYARSTIPLSSTIVADNSAAGAPNDLGQADEAEGGGVRLTNSLVEAPAGLTVSQEPAGSSIVGSDPALGALAENGGPTQTHLPALTSPVIDRGLANGLATDQRGQQRTVAQAVAPGAGDGTDIGAVEAGRPAQTTPGAVARSCAGEEATIVAVPGQPTSGTPGRDVIVGTPGRDVIRAGGGNDLICAGDGNDAVSGAGGNDRIVGGRGNDRLLGGAGRDRIVGGAGRDLIDGDAGNDRIDGDAGNDRINGGAGNDRVLGGAGGDGINGGAGNDQLSGGSGSDRIKGSRGSDRVSGNDGNDRLSGNQGNDRVSGGAGNDKVYGRGGNDRLFGGSGRDLVTGGGGTDRLSGGSAADRLFGNDGDDTLRGDSGADRLFGGRGEDALFGGPGDDRLFGGPGADRLFGGPGLDSLDGGPGEDEPEIPEQS